MVYIFIKYGITLYNIYIIYIYIYIYTIMYTIMYTIYGIHYGITLYKIWYNFL